MGLAARRKSALPHETWPNMHAAAQERFWDALTLACSDPDRGAGAIYLLGYVAEALLKTAYCQFNLMPINGNMYVALQSTGQKNLHNLTGLLNILMNARNAGNELPRSKLRSIAESAARKPQTGRIGAGASSGVFDPSENNPNPMDPAIAGAAATYVLIIEQHWQVNMRYYDFPATTIEVNEMLKSVEGLFSLYDDLWN